MAQLVAEPRGGVLTVHGQRQHTVPHRVLPVHTHWREPELETSGCTQHHGVTQLREDQVQQVKQHWCVRQ